MNKPSLSSDYWSRHRISRRGVLRGVGLGAFGLAGAALLGCSSDDATPGGNGAPTTGATGATGDPVRGGELRVATIGDFNTLDPAMSLSVADIGISQSVYDNLVLQQNDGTIRPMLAETLTPNADLTEYVATLRQGVKFHHGKDMVAQDVTSSLERLMDPATGSPGAAGLTSIDRIEATDDFTVKFTLNGPDAFFPDALSIYQARILPSDIDPDSFHTETVGTGPFRITEHRPGERTRMERFEDHWDEGLPYLDGQTWFYMPDPVSRMEAIRTGSVDVIYPLEAAQLRSAESGDIVVSEQASGTYLNLAMRLDREPFGDIRVRRALQYLTDRALILEAANYGRGEIGNDHSIPPFDPHFWSGQVQPGYDVAEATKLLQAAGFGAGLDLTLHTSTVTPGIQELAIAYREIARPGGVNVTIERASEDAYWSSVWLTEPFTTVSWNGRTADQALSIVYHSDAPWNESYYYNDEVDRLLALARGIPDQEERTETYGQIQQILIDDVPRIVPAFMPTFIGMTSRVGGLAAHPSNWMLTNRAWLQPQQ
ncbi:MAG: ABC transporter substrate-binding protein [Chloroflexi bacterium]|nr:ABC transporter substrate-binding protein [Chloroflexota bacterium]